MTVQTWTGVRFLLLLLAVICFVLVTFSVSLPVNLMALGLAFGFAAFLTPATVIP